MIAPDTRSALDRMQEEALALVKVIELEKSGTRDGSGYWAYSNPIVGLIENINDAHREYMEGVQ